MWNLPSFFSFGKSVAASNSLSPPAESKSPGREQEALSAEDAQEELLVVSPYTSRPHLLDLTALNQSQTFLAKALTLLSPVTHAYATVPYIEAFNWHTVFSCLAAAVKSQGLEWKRQSFYIVVFRSQIPPSTDRSHLAELDKQAHAEAMESGGLLKYWFGTPDADGRNLATCVWRRREDATPGSSGKGHKAAMRATISMYSEWHIERFKLVIRDNVAGWDIVPWID
ncbi:MAG: hypothetical protein Q9225_006993 [Loekoesia sp. 1 TL-2023]